MKNKVLILTLALVMSLFIGCARQPAPQPQDQPNPPPAADGEVPDEPDAVTMPSVATNDEQLVKAMSTGGTWIVILQEDFSTDQELVLEGEFTNRDVIDRKIALYAQDANRNKTATYTLKAPKLTVRSENARIVGGTFVGDVYVEANGFKLSDAKIEGNLYFTKDEFKATFNSEGDAAVTGVIEVKK